MERLGWTYKKKILTKLSNLKASSTIYNQCRVLKKYLRYCYWDCKEGHAREFLQNLNMSAMWQLMHNSQLMSLVSILWIVSNISPAIIWRRTQIVKVVVIQLKLQLQVTISPGCRNTTMTMWQCDMAIFNIYIWSKCEF